MRTITLAPASQAKRRLMAGFIAVMAASFGSRAPAQAEAAPATNPGPSGKLAPAPQRSASWPSFRGAGSHGRTSDADPPITWNGKNGENGENVLWKTAIRRHGMSSPVVSGSRLFLTAADEEIRQVLCFDTNTGKLLWHHDVAGIPGLPAQELPEVLEETGYASPTAVTDGRHVAAVFGTGELVCVNHDGERIWARHLGVPKNHYGHASSLICHGDHVIVQLDQKDDAKVLAFDFTSGKPVWQVKRGELSWSSPILVDNGGRTELVLTNSENVTGYDPKTGKRLWTVECLAGEVASSAAYADGVVFVANDGATATAVDISNHDEGPKILWQWDDALPDAASLLATKDYVILPTSFGVVTCFEAKTGNVCWEHEFDVGFYSSPILVNDRVYIVDTAGTMQIFKMDRKFEQVGKAELGEKTYATPAFVGDRIYLRGLMHLFCVGKR